MAFKPSLRSQWTLVSLAVICYGLYWWCETSRVLKPTRYYDQKITASAQTDRCLRALAVSLGEIADSHESYGDARLDAVIGQQFSIITTDLAIQEAFDTKIIAANPNFAAVVIDMLGELGIEPGDEVAIGCTGSLPATNIATICACNAFGVTPMTISAVGSSWWGANDPERTWLDMERELNTKGLMKSRPIAASLGGTDDDAFGLSSLGKNALYEAIRRNGVQMIDEKSVVASVRRRQEIIKESLGDKQLSAYINIGAGVASLGHTENGRLLTNGINRQLPVKNYPSRGLIHVMAEMRVPIINLYDIRSLSREYGLGGAQAPLPAVGTGEVFKTERYNLNVATIAAVTALLLIVVLVRIDMKYFRLREAGVDPETLL